MFTEYELYFLKKAINAASYNYPYRKKVYDSILNKVELMSILELMNVDEDLNKVKDLLIEEQKVVSKY
jgi:hypothetical protein